MARLHGFAQRRKSKKLEEVARTLSGGAEHRSSIDRDGLAAQLREMGAPDEVVARLGTQADDEEETPAVVEIEVLECNWDAVTVFLHTEPNWIAGMQIARMGIAAAEIRAACVMLRMPRARWPQLLGEVQHMGRVAQRVSAKKQ